MPLPETRKRSLNQTSTSIIPVVPVAVLVLVVVHAKKIHLLFLHYFLGSSSIKCFQVASDFTRMILQGGENFCIRRISNSYGPLWSRTRSIQVWQFRCENGPELVPL